MILAIERLRNSEWALVVLSLVLCALGSPNALGGTARPALASEELMSSQAQIANPGDEILLISTRKVGTVCNGDAMSSRLQCKQYVSTTAHKSQWISRDWQTLVTSATATRPTVIYIHGNRVSRGEDRSQGMQIYRSLTRLRKFNEPIRFIIWSWPSAAIPGPIKDYKVKARRTRPAAWQLAWFLDRLPPQTHVSLLGYSYGARVASGALHVLGGGSLGGLKLDQRIHPQHQPFRMALMAAAFDADWIQPGHFHAQTLSQVERLVIVTNHLDPIMRFYHLSNGRGRVHALGKNGIAQPRTLGSARRSIKMIDFTYAVGRNHALVNYLAASGKMRSIWQELLMPDTSARHSSLSIN